MRKISAKKGIDVWLVEKEDVCRDGLSRKITSRIHSKEKDFLCRRMQESSVYEKFNLFIHSCGADFSTEDSSQEVHFNYSGVEDLL